MLPRKSNHNLSYLKTKRKQLRTEGTKAEAILWLALKNKQIRGRRFRRQYSVGNYILDFYCPAEKIIIEVDGSVHADSLRAQHDYERTVFLESQGIRVVRFENWQVLYQLEDVVEGIASLFE